MKHFAKLLVSLVLMVLAPLTSQAQGVNDAFYIYQNDGHFNGFFYDEVIEIRYSKLDTLNLEHSDFVSQEIVTADSTYRIMLAAIDSVGFVQPEIKFNARVRDMEAEGMTKSLVSIEGQILKFHTYLDDDVKPDDFKVGDILVNYSFEENEGFSGKVTGLDDYGGLIVVYTSAIEDAKDIYEQFVTVEEYKASENGNVLSRRVAGMPMLGRGRYAPPSVVLQQKRKGKWDYDLLDFNFSASIPLNDNKLDINLIPNIEGKLNIRAEWNIPEHIGITTTAYYGLGLGLEVDGKVEKELNPPGSDIVTIPLPAAAPLFKLEILPNLFFRGDAHVKLAMQSPKLRGKVWSKFEFDTFLPRFDFGASFTNKVENEKDEEYYSQPNEASASVSFEGTVQAGIKFPLNLTTNNLLSYVFSCGIGAFVYAGPKLSGSASIDLGNVVGGDNTLYNNFKNSKIDFNLLSFDFVVKGYYKKFWSGEKEVEYNAALSPLPTQELYFFPQFENWQVKDLWFGGRNTDGSAKTFTCLTVKPSVWTVTPIEVGIETYQLGFDDEEKLENTFWCKDTYWQFKSPWLSKDNDPLYLETMHLQAGPHRMYPVFKFLGKKIRATQSFDYETSDLYLMVDTDTLTFGPNGGSEDFRIMTNTSDIKTSMNFREKPYYSFKHIGKQAILTMPRHEGLLTGYNALILTATDSKGITSQRAVKIVRKPSNHIGKFSFMADATGEGNSGGANFVAETDIQLGNSNNEHLRYHNTKHDGNYTITDDLDFTLDLSHPDSISAFGWSYVHIKGGTFSRVTTYDGVQSQSVQTCKVTITKPIYSSGPGSDDRTLGLFNQGVTNFNEDWSRDNCGVEVKCSSYTIQGGVIKNKVEWSSDPHFTLTIMEP